ncbi:MAG: SGNH/GDSL hydrolase family protein [Clostridiales bacterium]|jgi:lysophospholipase L1-like esterase|nr:SGNH/GDSL hydrolase family protein [Clostridiales bacterium]
MKKMLLCLLSALLTLPFLTACGGDGGGTQQVPDDGDKEPQYEMMTLDEIDEKLAGGYAAPGAYSADTLDKYLSPVWHSQLVYNEDAFIVGNADGTPPAPLGLTFPAAKILRVVKASDLNGTPYAEGTDYALSDGKLTVPEGSALPVMPFEAYFPAAGSHSDAWYYKHPDNSKTEVIGSNQASRPYMLSVTYARAAAWDGGKPVSELSNLTALQGKQAGTLNVLFVGDSLIEGAGPVHLPAYPALVADGLAKYTGRTAKKVTAVGQIQDGAVNWYNGGVGGITTDQYKYILDDNVNAMANANDYTKTNARNVVRGVLDMLDLADLVIVGLGTNDGGGWAGNGAGESPTAYKLRMGIILDKIRAANPRASILLVSPPRTNDRVYTDQNLTVPLFGANAAQYEEQLKALLPDYANAALAPLYGVQQTVLKNKPLDNLMGDGRNHPGDFFTRLFAQTVLTTVLKPGTLKVYPQDL